MGQSGSRNSGHPGSGGGDENFGGAGSGPGSGGYDGQVLGGEGGPLGAGAQRSSVVKDGSCSSELQNAARRVRADINLHFVFETRVLGAGFSGPVKAAVHRQTGRRYAVKRFDKAAKKEKLNMLRKEAQIYLRLDHPNIVRLIEVYEDDHRVYFIMEYCSGGDLYDLLCVRRYFDEDTARRIALQMLSAINYLHSHSVVHRDIKLENWLYESTEPDASLKLIDFGFSKLWAQSRKRPMQAKCGTLAYVSPDTLCGGYTNACDMWSLGVVMYMLLSGSPPFYGNERQIFDSVLTGNYSMRGPRWKAVSPECRDFVCRLLDVNPATRLSAKTAFSHKWLARRVVKIRSAIDGRVLDCMAHFERQSILKRGALGMIAYGLTSDQTKGMQKLFFTFDRGNRGTISRRELHDVMKLHFGRDTIDKIFRAMDSAGAGEVQYNDFLAVMLMDRLEVKNSAIREAFGKFDRHNSGFITLQNLKEVLGKRYTSEMLKRSFEAADGNSDGVIDFDEFVKLVKSTEAAFYAADGNRSHRMAELGPPRQADTRDDLDRLASSIGAVGQNSGAELSPLSPSEGANAPPGADDMLMLPGQWGISPEQSLAATGGSRGSHFGGQHNNGPNALSTRIAVGVGSGERDDADRRDTAVPPTGGGESVLDRKMFSRSGFARYQEEERILRSSSSSTPLAKWTAESAKPLFVD